MDSYIADISKTLTILCVEDDKDILEIYKSLFSLVFKKVYFATNGVEGFACFEKENIDIVLTDYQMPKCNGIQMSKKIREIDSSIPIIMVTALESIEMLREAIDIHVTSFLKKPFTSASLFSTFNLAVKSVIVDRCMVKEQREKILYSNYQEDLTFSKEKTITKNDTEKNNRLFDFRCEVQYKPKDILSGDSYVIRKLNDDEYLVFLVDGMGKGISASVTAMLCSAFVNYYIDQHLREKRICSLKSLLNAVVDFVKPNLLEYEVISAHFLYFNKKKNELQYAIFSMPPVLYMLDSENVLKIKSNNTPLASYTKEFHIHTLDISKLSKMIIYSDGLNENLVDNSDIMYNSYLSEDFKKAKNMEEFELLKNKKITKQEDDVTYVLITSSL